MERARPTQRPAWQALSRHYEDVKDLHLRELFADDPKRGERMTLEAAGLYLDYSKNRVTDETLRLLLELAEQSGLRERIDAMFRGDKINVTEDRAVLHVGAARAARRARSWSTARTSCPTCTRCSTRWPTSPTACAAAQWRGHTGKRISNVVNIGIGGSDLGPVMAYEALRATAEPRADLRASSPTSTAPTSSRRRATSTPPRRCSSSRRRPSPRSRR